MGRRLVLLGSLFAFLGVAMGAFGTHVLADRLQANGRQSTYDTAVQYHLIHSLAILLLSSARLRWRVRLTAISGLLFIFGILLFSGSLYILAIFDIPQLGAVAPVGGAAFLLGWFSLFLAAWRDNSE
ncbi:MAG: DUF423 domain-containing protein [Anaerolineae bacterium]|nr:DUF423 domain-containing protein [Anaerolineae bacterium]